MPPENLPRPSNAALPGQPLSISIIGDSLSSGFNGASGLASFFGQQHGSYAYPTYLGPALRTKGWNVEIENHAAPGATSDTGPTVAASLVRPGVKPPDLVILALGANDMLMGRDPDRLRENLEHTIQILRAKNVDVMIAGMKAGADNDPAYRNRFNKVYSDLAGKYNLVIDPLFIAPMVKNTEGRSLSEVFKDGVTNDGMHPNEQGANLISGGLLPYVEQSLNRVVQERQSAAAPVILVQTQGHAASAATVR